MDILRNNHGKHVIYFNWDNHGRIHEGYNGIVEYVMGRTVGIRLKHGREIARMAQMEVDEDVMSDSLRTGEPPAFRGKSSINR